MSANLFMKINERQAVILSAIIEEYIETAQAVASRVLVDKYDLGVSPATVRNDMAVLEKAGYLRQPHTSAGRVPTEDGYRLYLKTCVKNAGAGKVCVPLKNVVQTTEDTKTLMRDMAKTLVKLSGETAVASLDNQWNHYAGVSKLFGKPEFADVETLRALSQSIDQFDKVMRDIFNRVNSDVNIWIGGENPFGQQMATVIVKYQLPEGMTGLLGLVGPTRMNYNRNIRLLTQARNLLNAK